MRTLTMQEIIILLQSGVVSEMIGTNKETGEEEDLSPIVMGLINSIDQTPPPEGTLREHMLNVPYTEFRDRMLDMNRVFSELATDNNPENMVKMKRSMGYVKLAFHMIDSMHDALAELFEDIQAQEVGIPEPTHEAPHIIH